MDGHCATEQAAVASLQLIVDWVLDDYRLWLFWLCCVPVSFGLIQLGRQGLLKPPLPDGLL